MYQKVKFHHIYRFFDVYKLLFYEKVMIMDMMTIMMDTEDMMIITVDMIMIIMEVTMNILLVVTRITVAMVTIEGLIIQLVVRVVVVVLHTFLYIMGIITMTMLDKIPKCIPVLTQYFLTRRKMILYILVMVTKVIIILKITI